MIKILFLILALSFTAFGQGTSQKLTFPCAGSTSKASISFTRNGDVNIVPCPTRNVLFNGSATGVGIANLNGLGTNPQTFAIGAADTAIWNSSGSTHTLNLPISSISGASRSTYLPYFNTANTLAKSEIRYNPIGTLDFFPSNAFRFGMDTSGKVLQFGDLTGLDNYFSQNDTTGNTVIRTSNRLDFGNYGVENAAARFDFTLDSFTIQGANGSVQYLAGGNAFTADAIGGVALGDTSSSGNNTQILITDMAEEIRLNADSLKLTGRFDFDSSNVCMGDGILNGSGQFDLTVNACYHSAAHPRIFVTGRDATGALRNDSGVIKSSAGAGDSGKVFDFLIVGEF